MTPAEAKVLIPTLLDSAKTLDGDEKSEAHILLDHFFRPVPPEESAVLY